MKIRCLKSDLVKGVSIVSKAVPTKTTMPILECILIDATTDIIKLTANDMELGIETVIRGQIDEKGMIALDARIFSDIVRKLPDNEIVVSLDGHRISIRKIELKESYEPKKIVVPGKTLIEVSKILSGEADSEVRLYFTANHIVFEFDDTVVVSRLIEGEYFRIEQMLSNDYETKVRINKRELLNCIDRATLLVKEGDKKPIIINIQDEMMELKIKSEKGTMDEEIMITKEGKDLLIGFNPKFLIDALRVIDDEEADLYFMNAKAPCFIKDEGESYVYLILPVNFSGAV